MNPAYSGQFNHGQWQGVFPSAQTNMPQWSHQPAQQQYYQQHGQPYHAEHYQSPPPYPSASQASESSEPAPATWKEGAEKVKKSFSGIFDAIGKTFKKLFSKEGLSPLIGFFSRSFVDVGAEITKHVAKAFVPAFTDKNQTMYESTLNVAIGEIAALIKGIIPADVPLDSEFAGIFHGIGTAFMTGLSQFQHDGNENQAAKKNEDLNQREAALRQKEAEWNRRNENQNFFPQSFNV